MKHLMTQKFVLGLLMACVLALGVQGVAEALTLRATSPIVQSKRMGIKFEMTFTVGVTSNKIQYHPDYSTRRIDANDHTGPDYTYIDSSGYQLTYIGETNQSYRNTTGTAVSQITGGAFYVGNRASYTDEAIQPREATVPYLVDTSGNLFDQAGETIYIRTGAGTRFNNQGNADPADDVAANPYLYTMATFSNTTGISTATKVADTPGLHDYNDEAIGITFPAEAGMVKLKNPSFNFGSITTPTDLGASYTGETSLQERARVGLPSSVTLVCEGAAVGTHNIVIWDATNDNDFPLDSVPDARQPRQFITFTLHVTPATINLADGADITPDIQRVRTDNDVETVKDLLGFPDDGNYQIRYEVVRGSGTLYVGTFEDQHTTPSKVVSVHQASDVYLNTNRSSNEVHVSFASEDRSAPRATIIFEYKGQSVPTTSTPTTTPTTPTPTPVSTTPTLTLSSTTISGAAGSSQTVTATVRRGTTAAPGIAVTFQVGLLTPVVVSTNTSGQASHTFTLPSADTTLSVSANVLGTVVSASATLDVTGTTDTTDTTDDTTPVQVPTELFIDGDDEQMGEPNRRLPDDLVVRVVDANGAGVSGERVSFSIVSGRGRLSPARTFTDSDGYADVGFTPQSAGTIEIEASTGNLRPVTFTITTGEPPDAITVVSGNNQRGRPGAALANPFVVQVIDRNDDPVSGVSVSFSVTQGGGSVSPTSATTNNNGRAQTTLTLGDDPGDNTVRASVTGVSPVTFKATSGAEVLLNASQRPPMYWISRNEGKLHRLVADEIENLAPNVMGVTSIAIDAENNVLYLTVQTGENRGDIRRANLNGTNVRTLKTLTAVPRGITVDSTGDTLYWANSRGRIQSMPTAGSTKLTNVLENLRNPEVVVANGHLYWTESIGRIRRISLTDTRQTIQNIATGLGEPLDLSVAKGKVYWVERNAEGSGSLNRANLDGSNIQALKTFASGVPTSIAVDAADNKIYWTKGAGKIQRSNLAGKFVRDVASGLMGPTGIALSIAATDGQTATATPGTRNTEQANNAQMTYSRYDINRDGAVNNADTRAVAAAIGQSGADIANPRTDVDGSGTVDVTDLILVLGNLDDDVAAPTLAIDVKALDIDFDRVQEQVEVLLASGDASIAAQRALLYLQHLLASARPDETVLLANYPNPFNPETWIPYHLAESTDVKINIYDAQGVLVRELSVGHQSAGYYTSRSRAAYWDGRNALGERVASGIYFYQLATDEMSPLRKMVILK